MKIKLSNGCSYSKLSVRPKNWESKSAKTSQNWIITYRFYDPSFAKPKQVGLKGMNSFSVLQDRQNETRKLIEEETRKLQEGYNPFYKSEKAHTLAQLSSHEFTLLQGLQKALELASVSEVTKKDLGYAVKLFERGIDTLNWQFLRLSEFSIRHTKLLLEESSNSNDRFNKNRSYLMILLSILIELELVSGNFARDIKKKSVVKKIREVLTEKQRIEVNEYLKTGYPTFHRFLHIFYHSGARISELMKVKESDVQLSEQRFKVTIKKGKLYQEVWKVIKDIALPYWESIVAEAGKGQYLFGKDLKPADQPVKSYQIDKRWYRLVKKKLGIQADFYSLKHLHTTEVVDRINDIEAAKHNSHTTTSMVNQVYDVKKAERVSLTVKTLNNGFV